MVLQNKDKDGKVDYYDIVRLAAEAGLKHSDLVKVAKAESTEEGLVSPPIEKTWFSKLANSKAWRILTPRKNPKSLSEEDKERIKQFWLSPGISRVSPNKTIVVKRKSKFQDSVVESVFYRQSTVSEAFDEFKVEHPDLKCCRGTFFKYKPKNVKKPQSKQDCCPICKESKRYLQALRTKHHSYLDAADRRALAGFEEHRRLHIARSADYERQISNLTEGQAVLVMDFKANISLGGGVEEDSHVFFKAPQRTVFGLVAFFKKDGKVYKVFFTIVSPVLMHDTKTVREILNQCVFSHSVFKHFRTKEVSFWMDNAPGHFRTKEMIATFHELKNSSKMEVQFNYFAEYHGKSECDRHFGMISRIYTEHTSKIVNSDITTTEEFLTMYKSAILRFRGNIIPSQGSNHDELRTIETKQLNVVALEFTYEGAEEQMSASKTKDGILKDPVPLPLPHTRKVFQERSHFVFNYWYHFKFLPDNKLQVQYHQHFQAPRGDDDFAIPRQKATIIMFDIVEEERPDYEVRLGVKTSVRRKYSTLKRTCLRMDFHSANDE